MRSEILNRKVNVQVFNGLFTTHECNGKTHLFCLYDFDALKIINNGGTRSKIRVKLFETRQKYYGLTTDENVHDGKRKILMIKKGKTYEQEVKAIQLSDDSYFMFPLRPFCHRKVGFIMSRNLTENHTLKGVVVP